MKRHEAKEMDRILLEPDVHRITSLTAVTRWRMEKKGEFPRRRQISPGRIGWLESEIREWLASRPQSELRSPKRVVQ